MSRKIIYLFPVEQPIGVFYIGKMLAEDLINVSYVNQRILSDTGIQREIDKNRIKQINSYLSDSDATFPTSIILSVSSYEVEFISVTEGPANVISIEFDNNKKDLFEVIDGQHRLIGLKNNVGVMKELPIVILFDLTIEEKAYIFSSINSNQKQVNKSLIYDLYELNEFNSPIKFCHSIVRTLNSDENSPFYHRVKMLGKKNDEKEIISQGSFVDAFVRLISNDPKKETLVIKNNKGIIPEILDEKLVLRNFYVKDDKVSLYKIIFNYFSAVRNVFKESWNQPDKFILIKTTGIGALFKVFPVLFLKGIELSHLDEKFFESYMIKLKNKLHINNMELTSKCFGVGEIGQKKLSEFMMEAWK